MARNPVPGMAALLLAAAVTFSGAALAATVNIDPPVELTDDSIPGQQMNPASVVFDGLLYVFWASNSAETPIGQDFDITYATYDGSEWSPNVVLTSNDTGNDHTPQPVIFRDSLYLFWSSTNPTITGGSDADIVVSTLSGDSWSVPISITSGFNSTGDYDPCPVVFGSILNVFFECFSPQSAHYEIGHAALSSTWDPSHYMTLNSTGHNLNPTAAVAGQDLVLAWETTSDALAGSADRAIVSMTLSGGQWSGFVSVSGDAGPVNADPFIVSYLGTGWLFWSTDSDVISQGDDIDLVVRKYATGSWSDTVTELVAIQDSGDDTGAAATVHDGQLVLTWISDSHELDGESEADTDVMMVACDYGEWSSPVSISFNDGFRDDGGGVTHRSVSMSSYDGRLILIWETNASPLLTETRNTWLVVAECDLIATGSGLYFILVPAAIIVALVAFVLVRRRA